MAEDPLGPVLALLGAVRRPLRNIINPVEDAAAAAAEVASPRRAACSGVGVVSLVLLTVKPGPWCASGVGWRRVFLAALGRYLCRDGEGGGRADAGARREEAAARRAREARRPRMPAEPRRPAALPSEPAREARRRRPHSLDAGLVPDRGRDEAQRGEPRGGEGRGADRDLVARRRRGGPSWSGAASAPRLVL